MDANEEKKTDEKREQKPHSAFGWRQNVHWIERLQFRTVVWYVCTLFETGKPWKFLEHNFESRFSSKFLLRCMCVCERCWLECCTTKQNEFVKWICVEINNHCRFLLFKWNSRFYAIILQTLTPEHSSWMKSLRTHAQHYTARTYLQCMFYIRRRTPYTHCSTCTNFLCECVYF